MKQYRPAPVWPVELARALVREARRVFGRDVVVTVVERRHD